MLIVCVVSIFIFSISFVFRFVVWNVSEVSILVRYSNGGCLWCVYFIYDEYYMVNFFLVLNFFWENVIRGSFSRRLV